MKLKKYLCILLGMGFSLSALASNAAPAATEGEGGTLFMKLIRAITFTSDGNVPDFLIFLGRHHPIVLHLPVGLLAVIAFLEIFSWWRKIEIYDEAMYMLLWLAAITSVGAAGLGILLALPGGYNEELLSRHGWLGLAVAVAAIFALYLKIHYRRDKSMARRHRFRGAIFFACILMSIAGHDGGSLTHGTEYLFEYAPDPMRVATGREPKKPKVVEDVKKEEKVIPVFEAKILPLFEKNCVSCHGADKSKGDLRLDSLLMLARSFNDVIVPGNPEESSLYTLLVTSDEDDMMPPKGKGEKLSAEDIEMIRLWILNGASFGATEKDLKEQASLPAVEKAIGEIKAVAEVKPVTEVKPEIDLASMTADQRFVHEKLIPLFEAKCTKCHGEKKDKGDLRLHTVEMIKASFEEEVIVPGNPEDSWLYDSLITDDEDSVMPPPKEKNPMTKEEIEMIRKWIADGAKGLE
jgi:uncharacterized membrane protein